MSGKSIRRSCNTRTQEMLIKLEKKNPTNTSGSSKNELQLNEPLVASNNKIEYYETKNHDLNNEQISKNGNMIKKALEFRPPMLDFSFLSQSLTSTSLKLPSSSATSLKSSLSTSISTENVGINEGATVTVQYDPNSSFNESDGSFVSSESETENDLDLDYYHTTYVHPSNHHPQVSFSTNIVTGGDNDSTTIQRVPRFPALPLPTTESCDSFTKDGIVTLQKEKSLLLESTHGSRSHSHSSNSSTISNDSTCPTGTYDNYNNHQKVPNNSSNQPRSPMKPPLRSPVRSPQRSPMKSPQRSPQPRRGRERNRSQYTFHWCN